MAGQVHLRRLIVLGLSSVGGLGYSRYAPGSVGTLGGIGIWWLLSGVSLGHYLLVTGLVIALAIVVAEKAEKLYGEHDSSKIVIDEVAGMLVAAIGVPFRWLDGLAVFILFRIFDILKPPPIRQLDNSVRGGLGIVVDDVVAGAFACVVIHGWYWFRA